jgi:hypothetical protein
MKTTKSTLTFVLACLLTIILLFGGEGLWAKSQSATFEMTSDILCGTGGKSQSATYKLKVSAEAQNSPIGPQSSTNFQGGGGWAYTTLPSFKRGEITGDGLVNLGDIVFLIAYVFKSGPAPCPLEAGDVNCDGVVNLGDIVYLIAYVFRGGPPPCPGKDGSGILVKASRLTGNLGHAQISPVVKADLGNENEPGFSKTSPEGSNEVFEISIVGKFDREVAGVQLEIDFNPAEVTLLEPALTPLTKDLQLYAGIKDGTQKIGILDIRGENVLPAGEGTLVILRVRGEDLSSIKVKEAIVVDRDAVPLRVELSGELKVKGDEKSESKPEHFSLFQNYPNPFNPQTSIKYALPQDAQVKLVIYNVLGQKVKALVDEPQAAGYKIIWWDGKDERGDQVASGIYFYRLEADKFSEVKKMMLVK